MLTYVNTRVALVAPLGMEVDDDANSFLEKINPGNSVKALLLFDVPKSAKLSYIKLHDSMFSTGALVALK